MFNIVCTCVYETLMEPPGSIWTTALDFLFSAVIGVSGVMLNYRFMKKLQEEKKNIPLGRKGNVIEPIMSLYCQLQIVFWPYYLLLYWLSFNRIITTEHMKGLWCDILWGWVIRFGRMCIAYNSLFVALIRYIYIVHHQKASLWEFKNVGRVFRISSIAIPIIMEIVGVLTYENLDFQNFQGQPGYKECVAFYQGLNETENAALPKTPFVSFTLNYLPESTVYIIHVIYLVLMCIVMLNVAEGFLYFSIFRNMKR